MYSFIYSFSCFLVALGLCCCMREAVSGCDEQGPCFLAVCWPLAAALLVKYRLCGIVRSFVWAQLLYGRWGLPGPGIK